MRRLFWRLAYWPAIVAHRVFGASYKWVNVGKAAWHRELFDPLWHHECFGDPITAMPSEVNLAGHYYDVSSHEGLVTFKSEDWPYPPILFERDPHDVHSHLWRVSCDGPMWAITMIDAYRWIEAVYGGSFEKKR